MKDVLSGRVEQANYNIHYTILSKWLLKNKINEPVSVLAVYSQIKVELTQELRFSF